MNVVDAYRMRDLVRHASPKDQALLVSAIKVQEGLALRDLRYWRKKKHEHNWRSACKTLAILRELRARLESAEMQELMRAQARFSQAARGSFDIRPN